LIVNFFAGPGAGKSTSSALLFSKLKMRGVRCELVTEFAKDLTWEKRDLTLRNQLYILAKQHKRMWVVAQHEVDVIITDSPLLVGAYYSSTFDTGEFAELLRSMAMLLHKEHPAVNFFIRRTKPYQRFGRSQTEEQAKDVDLGMREMLDDLGIEYLTVETGEHGINDMLRTVANALGRNPAEFI